MEEVDGIDKRAIGNWTTDVFGSHYDTKLPLTAMRAMSGYDYRRGKFIHPRSGFYADASHAHLPGLLFPWVDDALLKTENTKYHTAYGFLSLIKNLRWIILHDATVMITKVKRDQYIYRLFKHVFDSDTFCLVNIRQPNSAALLQCYTEQHPLCLNMMVHWLGVLF